MKTHHAHNFNCIRLSIRVEMHCKAGFTVTLVQKFSIIKFRVFFEERVDVKIEDFKVLEYI